MIIAEYVKKGEDLEFSPIKDVGIFNERQGTALTQKRFNEMTALSLSKNYNHTVVILEKGEDLGTLHNAILRASPLGLVIIKLKNGKIVDFVFKDRNYNFYNKMKSDCSKKMLAGIKFWNASNNFKNKMMTARNREAKWKAYINK